MNIARYLKLLYHYSFYKGMVLAGLYDREFRGMGSFPKIPYAKIEQCNRKKTKVRPTKFCKLYVKNSLSGSIFYKIRCVHVLHFVLSHKLGFYSDTEGTVYISEVSD